MTESKDLSVVRCGRSTQHKEAAQESAEDQIEQSQTHDQRSRPYLGDRKEPGQLPYGNEDTLQVGEELRPHPVELLHRMRGVAGLNCTVSRRTPRRPADGGTSAAAPPTRTAFAGIRASAPPRCPRRAGCRPRGCGQQYGLPMGVDESATGPIVAILRERQPDVLLTHVANAPVQPGT